MKLTSESVDSINGITMYKTFRVSGVPWGGVGINHFNKLFITKKTGGILAIVDVGI